MPSFIDMLPDHGVLTWCVIALAVLAGGALRGLTGFGAALLMAPALSLVISSRETTCLVILLNTMPVRAAYSGSVGRLVDRTLMRSLFLSACVGLPAGIWLGGVLPTHAFGVFIGAVVIVSAIALMSGAKLANPQSRPLTFGVGAISGVLTGLAGIGGPPAILYVLAVEDNVHRARATFMVYFAFLYPLALGAVALSGLLFWQDVAQGLLLMPLLYLGDKLGEWLFARFNPRYFRPFVLVLLVCTGLLAMLRHSVAS